MLKLSLSTAIQPSHIRHGAKDLGGVDFPLLADMNLDVSKEFGMALEGVGITTRGVFIIDKAGNIAFKHVEAAPPDNTLTAEQVFRRVRQTVIGMPVLQAKPYLV